MAPVFAIDPSDKLFKLTLHQIVLIHPNTGGHHDQYQHDLSVPLRILLEEQIIPLQPVEYPLRVVKPVDRKNDPDLPQRGTEAGHFGLDLRR